MIYKFFYDGERYTKKINIPHTDLESPLEAALRTIHQKDNLIYILQDQIKLLKQALYGKSSEKLKDDPSNARLLFNDAEEARDSQDTADIKLFLFHSGRVCLFFLCTLSSEPIAAQNQGPISRNPILPLVHKACLDGLGQACRIGNVEKQRRFGIHLVDILPPGPTAPIELEFQSLFGISKSWIFIVHRSHRRH